MKLAAFKFAFVPQIPSSVAEALTAAANELKQLSIPGNGTDTTYYRNLVAYKLREIESLTNEAFRARSTLHLGGDPK